MINFAEAMCICKLLLRARFGPKYGPGRIRTCDQPVTGLLPIGLHFEENHRIQLFRLTSNDRASSYEYLSLFQGHVNTRTQQGYSVRDVADIRLGIIPQMLLPRRCCRRFLVLAQP